MWFFLCFWQRRAGGGEGGNGYSTTYYIFFLTVTGFPVTEEQLKEVAQHSGVLEIDDDFTESEFRTKCGRIILMPVEHHVDPAECTEAYKNLKKEILSNCLTNTILSLIHM